MQGDTSKSNNKVPTDVWLIPISACTVGILLGFSRGANMSSLKFLAMNAHRPPRTVGGWYFYNKTKNYKVLLGGFKGAALEGARLSAMGLGWVAIEQAWMGLCRRVEDEGGKLKLAMAKEVVAGGGVAGVVSAVYRFPRRRTMRAVGLGMTMGAIVSVLRAAQKWISVDGEEEDRAKDTRPVNRLAG